MGVFTAKEKDQLLKRIINGSIEGETYYKYETNDPVERQICFQLEKDGYIKHNRITPGVSYCVESEEGLIFFERGGYTGMARRKKMAAYKEKAINALIAAVVSAIVAYITSLLTIKCH